MIPAAPTGLWGILCLPWAAPTSMFCRRYAACYFLGQLAGRGLHPRLCSVAAARLLKWQNANIANGANIATSICRKIIVALMAVLAMMDNSGSLSFNFLSKISSIPYKSHAETLRTQREQEEN